MNNQDIEIVETRHLDGPNMWTYHAVIEAVVDIGALEDYPSNRLPGFTERLTKWLPTLIEHRCSYGERGGFVRRLEEGTWPAHILEHVTLELQNLAGMPGGFGRARETSARGVYKVVVRAWHETVTRAALFAARDLLMAAIEDKAYDVAAAVAMLKGLVSRHCLGAGTACIVEAAAARGIPVLRLAAGDLVQLGHGCRQRRIWNSRTDRTSAIAEGISQDGSLTMALLAAAGVPVVEDSVAGAPHRLLVVGGRVVAAARCAPLAADVTDSVHADVAAAATLAARVVGLDIAGIDVVAHDLAQPLEVQHGAVVGVTAEPDLLMHLQPAGGQARPVGRAIVDHLFTPAERGRVPLVGVAGTRGTTPTAQLVAYLLRLAGHHVGLACRAGLYLDARRVEAADAAHRGGARKLLLNRSIDAAVCENGPLTMLTEGLAYDRCTIGVVMDLELDREFERHGMTTVDQAYTVLRTQVDVVLPDGVAVLNACDERAAAMASLCDGSVILFATDAGAPALAAHRAAGGRTVCQRDGAVTLGDGTHDTRLLAVEAIPMFADAEPTPPLESLLAAVAAAWALGIAPALIATGIETFAATTIAAA